MRFYALLDRVLPRSYLAKALAVAIVLGHGPILLGLLAYAAGLVPAQMSGLVAAAAAAAAALASLAGLGIGLAAVLRPIGRLEAALTAYETGQGEAIALPDHHRDAVGRLMAQANRLIRSAETRIDAAQQLADRDPLTGLLNRRGLERNLESRHSGARPGTVIMMDLDHFKRVNDVYGHDTGDRVLRDLARILRRHMRRPDLAARFGGEEFVIYLSGSSQTGASRVAERLRMAVEDNLSAGGQAQTVSIGVAPWSPGEPFPAILKRADMAVYAAKAAGRNRVHLAPASRTASPQAPAPSASAAARRSVHDPDTGAGTVSLPQDLHDSQAPGAPRPGHPPTRPWAVHPGPAPPATEGKDRPASPHERDHGDAAPAGAMRPAGPARLTLAVPARGADESSEEGGETGAPPRAVGAKEAQRGAA